MSESNILSGKLINTIGRFCASRERCEKEVIDKLNKLGVYDSNTLEQIINHLKEEGFVDNKRFARAFCIDKFRFNKWGRIKIVNMLKQYTLESDIINYGLSCIDESEYIETIRSIIEKYTLIIKQKETDNFVINNKVINYLLNKGFEYEIVRNIIRTSYDK
ncbi:MAG: hypothetical protein A2X12_04800 [Bacteroidetes bacterium GWE2_29_8]|nr:MAG: hypothetical protein A2X12_04800 [Bacteroidetes bacterium GWE2_29_8]OFY13807.1 MAG: hypothetical protein A2X02_10100 [Bacteroidetes bacterium GWF2_29_10]